MKYINYIKKLNQFQYFQSIHYIIKFTFDIDFLKNLINLILFYVFNLTVLYTRLYIFHLYLFGGLFVYFTSYYIYY